ncbi:Inward rectifier potassium channel Irk [Flavobacterium rivuli WB 3.3-2 = DSM 21788]|uniref:Inward rectifier potassium channel Irk n=1 Tax=Flavobacterium rivuli WB 3.3-2 = DSM 21788 TaxID=1121895 RepID=A0A0A2M8A2_9FLAO|nr:ion channel [Flavobacterium rivuli]KGO87856.1 Inward rectifier potassium channel Irk [Flavobacterium rivuli WB 3.3-2 = DSM 21788]
MDIFRKKVNTQAKTIDTSGFGTNPSSYGGRFINKDGSANIEKRGLTFFSRISWYHTMLNMPGWKFLSLLVTFYMVVNFIFALLYYAIGIEYLDGIDPTGNEWLKFGKAYFFSAQTFTTVGYGHISPSGFLTSALSAAEALTGLLSFAIATGLFYGRFSRPKAFLKFSHNALIAPYHGGTAFMIRFAPFKNTKLIDAEARMTLGMTVMGDDGIPVNKFYVLPLEMERITALSLSWTLVHPITEQSPFHGFTKQDFAAAQGEVIVYVKAFDDLFSNTVAISTSYTFDEIIYGAKFEMMYAENEDNTKTVLYLDKLNAYKPVHIG